MRRRQQNGVPTGIKYHQGAEFVALNNTIDFSVSLLAVLKFGAFGFFERG
jgi:hypothetical protein